MFKAKTKTVNTADFVIIKKTLKMKGNSQYY